MDPQTQFCHNPQCTARGQLGLGNISVHSRKELRYRYSPCGRTFAATRDTPFYRLKKSADLVTLVITLLCHGCPLQAIVAAFGLDERTVADWRDRAGRHAQQFHDHRVLTGQLELGHVQAEELFVKMVARRLWMAMAMAVPSRLWLGGVVSERRDLTLIMTVVGMVRRAAKSLEFMVCVDGLASYVTAFTRVFRDPERTGRRGRPRLKAIPGLLLGQVIKHHSGRRLVDVTRRVVLGTTEAIAGVLSATGTGTGINTSYIERLNATFRASMCPLTTEWLYDLACYRSLLVGVFARHESGMSSDDGEAMALSAISTLRQAIESGFRNLAHMKTDADLDPLRSRPDFQLLMRDLALPPAR